MLTRHIEVQEAAAEVESFMGLPAWFSCGGSGTQPISADLQGMDVYVTQILAELYYLIDEEGGIPSPKRAAALLGEPGLLQLLDCEISLF